jgi:hygromycin-B 7''-O-kinase
MARELIFDSEAHYRAHLTDTNFWQPMISDVLRRHNLEVADAPITAGFNGTNPVFLLANLVVKFFGHRPTWQAAWATECAAHQRLAQDEAICAPRIMAQGELFPSSPAPWPYIVSTRIPGASWEHSVLTPEQQHGIVRELGAQLQRIHALPVHGVSHGDEHWGALDVPAAAVRSSLPQHLVGQVDDFLATLEPFDRVFVNGDIVAMHVFVNEGRLSGIIDWGDATVTDRHYEIGKIYTSLFPGNKALLRTLLDAANWPVTRSFARQSLGMALYRQAVGLTQHHTFDIFYKLPDIFPFEELKSLEELAHMLFAVE